jgi:hypothetical protein
MSDVATIVATPTPGVTESGPASGTTPGAGIESAAPADFSSVPAAVAPEAVVVDASVVADAAPTETKTSILSEAVGEKPTEAAPEAKPETEAKPADPVVAVAPVYEQFKLPENVTLDETKLGGFTGLLGEFEQKVSADPAQAHAAAQEFGQKLLDLYVTETQQAAERQSQAQVANWEKLQETWATDFRNDAEIGKNRAETSLTRMGGLMDMYGQSAGPDRLQSLRGVLALTGAGNNLEVLRFVNWAASRLVETSRPIAAPVARAPQPGSRATRLYKNSAGAA